MSSKRFGNFQLKQPSTAYKKARLDIDVPGQQQQPTTSVRTPTTVAKSSKKTDDYLWGDEDDEFIILASQAVEEVELFQASQSGEVTFGRFSKQQSLTSSTQRPAGRDSAELMPPPAAVLPGTSRTVTAAGAAVPEVIDLLTDDDDDVFSEQFVDNYDNVEKHIDDFFKNEFDDDFNLNEFQQNGCRAEEEENRDSQRNGWEGSSQKPLNGEATASVVFKPKQPVASSAVGPERSSKGRLLASQQQIQANKEAQLNAAKKKDHAKDIQLKFLTNQLELASKKTEHLQKDYNEALEKMQTRDGEVSILQYELKNVKRQNDQLRLDKMKESETMQKEWVEKMKDLEKVIVAQKAELEFKSMEMMTLKSKRVSSTVKAADTSALEKPVTEEDFKIHNRQLCVAQRNLQPLYEIDPKIFELSAESISKFNLSNRISGFSKADAILSQHLGYLQTCLSQMVCQRSAPPEDSVLAIEQTTSRALEEIQKYCSRLQPVRVKDANLAPKVSFDFLCKNSQKDRLEGDVNIFQREPVCCNEQGVIQRRFLAALGLLVRYVPSLAVSLVRRQDGGGREHCAGVLGKALKKLSYTNDLYNHLGMTTAAALVLCGFTHHLLALGECAPQVTNLFKSIVYCRPDSAHTLTYLSEALYRISASDQTVDLLNELCWRCKSSSFTVNDTYKMIQFTKDSCALQIYAVLLETSVPQNRLLTPLEIRRLVTNTQHTLYLLRNAVTRPVRWVRQFYEDSRKPRHAHPAACQCHIRITNAFVVLLHQVLRCWSKCPLSIDINTLLQIAQNGVLLLYDLFQTAYRPAILYVGGHSIQCRLQACYNWLVQHQNDFRFQPAHKTALRLLDLRLVMDEPLKSSDDEDHKLDAEGLSDQDSLEQERRHKHDDLFEDFFTSKLLL